MSKNQSLSQNSLEIRIEDEIYKSETSSSVFSVPISRSFESNLNNVNETKKYLYSNGRRTSVCNASLKVPNQSYPVRRQISSSPVKSKPLGWNSKRRLSQDSGIDNNREYIACYNVSKSIRIVCVSIKSAKKYAVELFNTYEIFKLLCTVG